MSIMSMNNLRLLSVYKSYGFDFNYKISSKFQKTFSVTNLKERWSFPLSSRSCLFPFRRLDISFRFPVTLVGAVAIVSGALYKN